MCAPRRRQFSTRAVGVEPCVSVVVGNSTRRFRRDMAGCASLIGALRLLWPLGTQGRSRSWLGRSVIKNPPQARICDNYVVGKVVGSGVYGTVSLATGKHCGRKCVVKAWAWLGGQQSWVPAVGGGGHTVASRGWAVRLYHQSRISLESGK